MPKNKAPEIIVCINGNPKTGGLLRAAKNRADELGVGWCAIYVETPQHYLEDRETRERVLLFMTLAQEMGAEVIQLEHSDEHDAIVNYVQKANAADGHFRHLIIGQTSTGSLFAGLRPSLAEKVTRKLGKIIEVQVIPLPDRDYTFQWYERLQTGDIRFKDFALAIVSVGAAYLTVEFMRRAIPAHLFRLSDYNVSLVFLLACVITSLRGGLLPGFTAAIGSFLLINYAYLGPASRLELNMISDGINLTVFLLCGVAVSLLGGYTRAHVSATQRREQRSQALYKIHRVASNAQSRDEALRLLHDELSRLLDMKVAFFIPPALNPDSIVLTYPKTAEGELSTKDFTTLERCWKEIRTTGLGTTSHFGSSWRFEPMSTPSGEVGVIGVKVPLSTKLDASFGRMFSALADQAASILERIELTKAMGEILIREEREKLRAMLLSSVSHDLKTPLASIIGALSVYRSMKSSGHLSELNAEELIDTAIDEAQRLDSFITNILDMTRIESGAITFKKEWQDPYELVMRVEKRLRQRLRNHELVIHNSKTPLEVQMDPIMTEQVLQNVLDNAAKYSPKNNKIELSLEPKGKGFTYIIRDFGDGIPEDKLESVFDKFERLHKMDSKVAGTGLGLAISRSVMYAQEGYIKATNHPEKGAVFTIFLPKTRKVQGRQVA